MALFTKRVANRQDESGISCFARWLGHGQSLGGDDVFAFGADGLLDDLDVNEIRAPRAGTVSSISVEVGDRVELGSDLAVVG